MQVPYLFTLLVLLITGCSTHVNHPASPIVTQQRNGVQVRAKFMDVGSLSPSPVQRGAELMADNHSSGTADYLCFDIQLEQPGFTPDKKTTDYLDFNMDSDFTMVNGPDTLMSSFVHRVANGRKDAYEYLVFFSKLEEEPRSSETVQIIYNDKIFGLGQQIFAFKKQEIKSKSAKTN